MLGLNPIAGAPISGIGALVPAVVDPGDGGAVAPYPGPAGASGRAKSDRRPKRKKYVLDGQALALTRDELEDALETLLTRPAAPDAPAQPAKVKAKDAAIVAQFPAYPDVRDMLLAAQQIEAAQALRAVAQRLADDEDERDVEMLLLWG